MALIEINDLSRQFEMGGETVRALDGVSLAIEAGELVAIVGASGSGKSTLMNILGCLDQPSQGSYRFDGRETRDLPHDALAQLRRQRFGFIFQRYHLMSNLTAAGNVEVPAVYEGINAGARSRRSHALLEKLGLAERVSYRPNKMSGGQQQRVSIARALMNGGEVILADEPTGALDPKSGAAVMEILKDLNADGHTIIIVTHDMGVAEQAGRVIEIHGGKIIADRLTAAHRGPNAASKRPDLKHASWLSGMMQGVGNAVSMATGSMLAQPLRTFLTMLGIVIGIAAVAAVVAIGEGSQQRVADQLADLGASTIELYPGKDWGDERASAIRTMVAADADALARQPYIRAVTPTISANANARYGAQTVVVSVTGVGTGYFEVYGRKIIQGRMFGPEAIAQAGTDAVIDANMARRLFGSDNPLGKVVMVGRVPVTIAGVAATTQASGRNLAIYLPYTSVGIRMSGSQRLDGMVVRLHDGVNSASAEAAITALLTNRHGAKDFFAFNSDQIRKTVERTSKTVSQLITAVAIIALTVGGIGVMNIMLVSVTERTKEIGLRMAVGARTSDIMLQFLVEATVICIIGAVVGVGLALGCGLLIGGPEGDFPMIFSPQSILLSCAAATIVGLTFGFFPARNAARLEPVDALSRD